MTRILLTHERSLDDFEDAIIVRAQLEDDGTWSAGFDLGINKERPSSLIVFNESRETAVAEAADLARSRVQWLEYFGHLNSEVKWHWVSRERLTALGYDPDEAFDLAHRAHELGLWEVQGKEDRCRKASALLEYEFLQAHVEAIESVRQNGLGLEKVRDAMKDRMDWVINELRFVSVDWRRVNERLDICIEEIEKEELPKP